MPNIFLTKNSFGLGLFKIVNLSIKMKTDMNVWEEGKQKILNCTIFFFAFPNFYFNLASNFSLCASGCH
jgi:hypothetical protein